jgi:tetratricopeptide (TPR) repeat protein
VAECGRHLFQALLKRARVRRSMGLFDDAVVDYEAAKKIEPDNKKVAKELPQVAQAQSAQNMARQVFQRARAMVEANNHVEAKRLYQQSESLNITVPYLRYAVAPQLPPSSATTAVDLSFFAHAAHSTLAAALKTAPDAADSLAMDAEAMLAMGLNSEVIQTAGRLLKTRPDSREGFLLRGKAYLNVRACAVSLRHASHGELTAPCTPTQEGDTDTAMKHFKEGYKSDPDHKGLKSAYKDLKKYLKLSDSAINQKNAQQWQRLVEDAGDALKLIHGPDMDGKPEVDQVTVKLREALCKGYAMLGQANEVMACANRVLKADAESIEGAPSLKVPASAGPRDETLSVTVLTPP